MSYGYTGKIIRINLTTEMIIIEEPDDIFYRTYIGGKGFVSYYLLKELPPDVDALSPSNKLIFATGILTGIPVAAMPRFAVGAKSPLTGGYGQSESGGFWGPELKKAGYDGIIIEGKASKPVYININNEKIEIKDASNIWGKDTGDAQDIIRKELGDNRVRVAQIGPGGEKLVRYACIVNELKHANGRNGLGAVMGSKNLKAIAVKGTRKIQVSNPDKVNEISRRYLDMYMDHPLSYGLYALGTSGSVTSLNEMGILPTRNFTDGEFEGAKKISGLTMNDTILKNREGCYACAIRCKRAVEVNNDKFKVDKRFGGPEYETIGAFGSLCSMDNLESIAKAHELCNRYAIDTISTGVTIAFVIECYESGILTKDDIDGIEACYGNDDAILKLIEKIGKRDGIGDLLAEGSLRASKIIGKNCEEFVLTVKGQELPLHDPRGKIGVGIGYAISETGADHMLSPHDSLFSQDDIIFRSISKLGILEPIDVMDMSWKKIRLYTYMQILFSYYNSAGICDFGPAPRGSMPLEDLIELIKAVTGWDTSLWEIMKAGERATNMSRLFNIREGFTKKDDVLPNRLHQPLGNGSLKGSYINKDEFNKAISIYYEIMGWDDEGIPKNGKLYELNLGEFV